jgi:hypothetical protein
MIQAQLPLHPPHNTRSSEKPGQRNAPLYTPVRTHDSAKHCSNRITDRAHVLETGTESYRFCRTAEKQKKGAKAN